MTYEIIDHTADLKLRIKGNSLEELFSEAFSALMKLLKSEVKGGLPTPRRNISIEAGDKTALLIDFLSEALAMSQTHKEIYSKLTFNELTSTRLQASLEGAKVENFDEDIKAVTYYEAEIKKNEKGEWETFLVFDI